MNEITNETIIMKNNLENSENILKQKNDSNFLNSNFLISKQNNSNENERYSNFINILNKEYQKKYFCNFCQKFFHSKDNLKNHLTFQCNKIFFICRFCQRYYSNENHLIKHSKNLHKKEIKKLKKLNNNNLILEDFEYFPKNLRINFEPLKNILTEGEKLLLKNSIILTVKQNKIKYKIEFLKKNLLPSHNDINIYNIDNNNINNYYNYNNSHNNNNNNNKQYFLCNKCNKKFLNKINLKFHSREHIKQNPFICNICQKTFGVYFNLLNHLKIHKVYQINKENYI